MKTYNLKMFFHVQSRAATRSQWRTLKAFPSYDDAVNFAKSLDEDGLEPNGKTLRIQPIAQ
jgi:hypothetical protein